MSQPLLRRREYRDSRHHDMLLICDYLLYIYNKSYDDNDEQMYNRIAILRAERGLSRKQLADALGVNFQTIGYLERGDYNASLELALKLATYFDLPVEMIFSLEPFELLSRQAAMKER